MELQDGAWCRLKNGRVTGPAVPVTSLSGHQFLVGGLYYTVAGECQSGREYDVVFCGKSPENVSEMSQFGAEVISLAASASDPQRMAASTTDIATASLSGDADDRRSMTLAVATSFGQISGKVTFAGDGSIFVSEQCLQIANGEPLPLTERALDRCGILRGENWLTFREILVEAATREVAA